MIKLFLLSGVLATSLSFATCPKLTDAQKEYLKKEGLPLPCSGITIVDMKQMMLSDHQKQLLNTALEQEKMDGYRHEFSQAATNLLNIDELLKPEFKRIKKLVPQKQSANITTDLSNIKMAYDYVRVPSELSKRFVSFAPTGTYIDNEDGDGWIAITEYFISNFDAPCSFEENNIRLSGSSSVVPKQMINYAVNNKITESMTLGDTTGYLYQVQWTNDDFRRTLRCASKHYSVDVKGKTLELAIKIDNR